MVTILHRQSPPEVARLALQNTSYLMDPPQVRMGAMMHQLNTTEMHPTQVRSKVLAALRYLPRRVCPIFDQRKSILQRDGLLVLKRDCHLWTGHIHLATRNKDNHFVLRTYYCPSIQKCEIPLHLLKRAKINPLLVPHIQWLLNGILISGGYLHSPHQSFYHTRCCA